MSWGAQLVNERPPEHSPPPEHKLTPRRVRGGVGGQRFVQGVRYLSLFKGLKAVHGTGAQGGHVATRGCTGTAGGRKGGSSRRGGVPHICFHFPTWVGSHCVGLFCANAPRVTRGGGGEGAGGGQWLSYLLDQAGGGRESRGTLGVDVECVKALGDGEDSLERSRSSSRVKRTRACMVSIFQRFAGITG